MGCEVVIAACPLLKPYIPRSAFSMFWLSSFAHYVSPGMRRFHFSTGASVFVRGGPFSARALCPVRWRRVLRMFELVRCI